MVSIDASEDPSMRFVPVDAMPVIKTLFVSEASNLLASALIGNYQGTDWVLWLGRN